MSQIGFFYNGWEPLARIVIVGTLAYLSLVLLLRISQKRSLAQLNAFDFIVTVALGASFGRVLTARQVALSEAITAFALLVTLQFLISWLQVRSKRFSHFVTAPPSLLYYQGRFLEREMRKERVTRDELHAVVMREGIGSLEGVAAIVLEANGKFAVVKQQRADHPALVEGRERIDAAAANRDD